MKAMKSRSKQITQRLHHITMIIRHGQGDAKPVDHLFSAFHERKPRPAADQKDLDQVTDYLRTRRLEVVESSPHKRTVVARGTRAALARVFGPTGKHTPPAELHGIVHDVIESGSGRPAVLGHKMTVTSGEYADPLAVASHYKFPEKFRGDEQCVALIMLGGGFYERDLDLYFDRLGLKKPKIDVVEISHARNSPASVKAIAEFVKSARQHKPPQLGAATLRKVLWTWETTQDIQLVGTFANDARIVVYFAPNDADGRYHALSSAIHDRKHAPSVVCCSWHIGFEQDPDAVTARERGRLNDLFEQAGHHGVTVCFSSGDVGDGSQGPPPPEGPKVCFPASSPHVLGCGGTDLVLAPSKSESVWFETGGGRTAASGGGCSRVFRMPTWQDESEVYKKTGLNGRGVPDVAAKANLHGGYLGFLGGHEMPNGGTSASAPLWASVIAILNEALGTRLGFINPLLYRDEVKHVLHSIVKGSNGAYHASKGWNPCTGLGTPDTAEILAKLQDLAESPKVRALAAKAK
jgi:kumamolisin